MSGGGGPCSRVASADVEQERGGAIDGCRVERGNGHGDGEGWRSLDERRECRGELTRLLVGGAAVVGRLLVGQPACSARLQHSRRSGASPPIRRT